MQRLGRVATWLLLVALVGSCTWSSSPETTTTVPYGCDAVADDTITAIQDFLDRLGDVSAGEAPMLRPLEQWLAAYADLHQDTIQVIGFVRQEVADGELAEIAQSAADWSGVNSVRVMSQSDAVAEARELFADAERMLEIIEQDPTIIPRSIRLVVDRTHSADVLELLGEHAEISDTQESRPQGVVALASGLTGVGVAEPYLRQPTADAHKLDCTSSLLDSLKLRAGELEPHGSAGEAFIAGLFD